VTNGEVPRLDVGRCRSRGCSFRQAFRYSPLPEQPGFVVHELATGPMNAGIFPNRAVDPTLNPEVLFFHGPATPGGVSSWTEAKRWFNFGTLEVDADGDLTVRVVNTTGEPRFTLTLPPD
jgi:alkaline phosphatase D